MGVRGLMGDRTVIRTLTVMFVACAVLALPAVASAKGSAGGVDKLAAKACAQERKDLGRTAFAKKYGADNPMRACVRRTRGRARAALRSASEACQQELAELGPADFADEWASDDTGADALAECIAFTAEGALAPDVSGDETEDDDSF
jgi:hypothetical protein